MCRRYFTAVTIPKSSRASEVLEKDDPQVVQQNLPRFGEGSRKSRVNGVALQSNGLVGLPTGKQLQLQPESLNFDGRERVQHEARLRPALLRPAKLGIILVNRRRRGICTEGVPTNFEDAA